MSITSAMFTGVSGLLANAEGINVIGNNLANVNTIGYKSGRILFSDMLSANIGNDSQIGRGSKIQKVDNLFSQSSFETTAITTDLAIQGKSFFAVKDPNISSPITQNNALLTRAGAFRMDNNLNLVNADGYQVLDTQGNPIKFSDNATGIATAMAALSTQLTPLQSKATTLDTNALAMVTAANTAITTASALPDTSAILTALQTDVATLNTDTGLLVTAAGAGTATDIANANAIQAAVTVALNATNAAQAAPTNTDLTAKALAALNDAKALIASYTGTFSTAGINAANATLTTDFTAAAAIDSNFATYATTAPLHYSLINAQAKAISLDNSAATLVTAASSGTAAEQVTAAKLKAATAAASAAAAAANAAPADPTLATAALASLESVSTLIGTANFTTAGAVTAYTNLNTTLSSTPNLTALTADYTAAALGLNNAIADLTAANKIKTATAAALTSANLAVASPSNTTLATNTLTALSDAGNLISVADIKTPSVVASYVTLNSSLTGTPTITDLTSAVTTATNDYTKQLGLAFSKINSIDKNGLISYLGKDGTTVNYYNVSGAVGVTANETNAATAQRLAVVNVNDANSLEKIGGTLFKSNVNAGVPSTSFTLTDNGANGISEQIYTNSLEQSNVDMAAEFVKMILTQRAYSANAKTITTSDEMTQEVIGLKR